MVIPIRLDCACFASEDGKSFIVVQHTDERGDPIDGSANFRAEVVVNGERLPSLQWTSEEGAFMQAKRFAEALGLKSTGKWY